MPWRRHSLTRPMVVVDHAGPFRDISVWQAGFQQGRHGPTTRQFVDLVAGAEVAQEQSHLIYGLRG